VQIRGGTIHFEFRGKSGIEHAIDLQDRRLAKIVKACQDLPGHELFQYVAEDGKRHSISSDDVNAYLHAVAGEEFTAKDFRTWAGTVLAAIALRELGAFNSATQAKKNIVEAIASVAQKLGNTKAVCRKCYIHPAVLSAYLDGSFLTDFEGSPAGAAVASAAIKTGESSLLSFLRAMGRAKAGKSKNGESKLRKAA
jgi:DNA topoisomerase-1